MKKLLSLVLTLTLAFSLAACHKQRHDREQRFSIISCL